MCCDKIIIKNDWNYYDNFLKNLYYLVYNKKRKIQKQSSIDNVFDKSEYIFFYYDFIDI